MRTTILLTSALTLILAAAVPAGASDLPASNDACGGVAPTVTNCTTGTGITLLGQVACGVAHDYVGTVWSILTWSNGSRGISCSKATASSTTTSSFFKTGFDPLPGMTATHTCSSNAYGTTTPGGSGEWVCSTQH